MTKLGLKITDGHLVSQHTKSELRKIFDDIILKIKDKKITTRSSRGKVYDVLEQETRDILENNKEHEYTLSPKLYIPQKKEAEQTCKNDTNNIEENDSAASLIRKTKRIQEPEIPFFGKDLYLRAGIVNNLYRDILDLHRFYKSQKLSKSFSGILRMSLRLLCETASSSCKSTDIKPYILKYFDEAKKQIDQNQKTLLANQNVTKDSLTQLLHTGAHNYRSSCNYEQTLAISIILGAMLSISHGKEIREQE